MRFKEVRALVIQAVETGHYQHEERAEIDEKNLLHASKVTPEFVVRLLHRCSGEQYRPSRHHIDPTLVCHVFTPDRRGERWYVKVYFRANVAVFVSVHRS